MVLAVILFQAPTIIIRRIEFEFDCFHLSPIDHLDQKKSLRFFLKHLFQYCLTSNTLQLTLAFTFTFTLTPMTKAFTTDQKTMCGLMDTLVFLVTEKLRFESVRSS